MALAAAWRRSLVAVWQSIDFAALTAALAEESDTSVAAAATGSGAGGSAVTSKARSAKEHTLLYKCFVTCHTAALADKADTQRPRCWLRRRRQRGDQQGPICKPLNNDAITLNCWRVHFRFGGGAFHQLQRRSDCRFCVC